MTSETETTGTGLTKETLKLLGRAEQLDLNLNRNGRAYLSMSIRVKDAELGIDATAYRQAEIEATLQDDARYPSWTAAFPTAPAVTGACSCGVGEAQAKVIRALVREGDTLHVTFERDYTTYRTTEGEPLTQTTVTLRIMRKDAIAFEVLLERSLQRYGYQYGTIITEPWAAPELELPQPDAAFEPVTA